MERWCLTQNINMYEIFFYAGGFKTVVLESLEYYGENLDKYKRTELLEKFLAEKCLVKEAILLDYKILKQHDGTT